MSTRWDQVNYRKVAVAMKRFTATRVCRLAGLAIIVSICIGAGVPVATSAHAAGSVTSQDCRSSTNWEGACL